jgi:gp16 family phage-associated protein
MTRKRGLPKTAVQVRQELSRKGISISGWASDHGFGKAIVQQVLSGRLKARIGKSHKIAVLLGMKDGEITS